MSGKNLAQIKTAEAVYTGGGIYIFHGGLEDGTFFLVDDNGCVEILDESAEDFDVSLYIEWIEKHRVVDGLEESDRIDFCNQLCDYLKEHDNGMTEYEVEVQRKWFSQPL